MNGGGHEHSAVGMNANRLVGRRGFLAGAAALGAGLVTAGCSGTYDWYALSRRQFRGKAFFYAAILAGIMIPPQALIVPLFREFQTVHLINTYWALLLPQVPAPIAVFIFKKFFDGIPIQLEQAAEVDGPAGGPATGRSRCRWPGRARLPPEAGDTLARGARCQAGRLATAQ